MTKRLHNTRIGRCGEKLKNSQFLNYHFHKGCGSKDFRKSKNKFNSEIHRSGNNFYRIKRNSQYQDNLSRRVQSDIPLDLTKLCGKFNQSGIEDVSRLSGYEIHISNGKERINKKFKKLNELRELTSTQ